MFFFYRYNTERLCNDLKPAVGLTEWTKPIPEAYFPKLDRDVASRTFPPRAKNSVLCDVERMKIEGLQISVQMLQDWLHRIRSAIKGRFVVDVST